MIRLRRSVLAVPGSNPRKMAKAATTAADEVFLDLEDAVAPSQKDEARRLVVEALRGIDFGTRTVSVRVNSCGSMMTYADIVAVVEGAGDRIDCIMLPKVESYDEALFASRLLEQIERHRGITGRSGTPIGLEVIVESPSGLFASLEIARLPRVEALIFGPGDYSAALGLPHTSIGEIDRSYPGDKWHFVASWLVNAARAAHIQAIDGPYALYKDSDGLAESASRSRALGYDGKMAIHPDQIDVLHRIFGPDQATYDRAEEILEAYARALAAGQGVAAHDGEMIDEASRRMAEVVAGQGRALGMTRSGAIPAQSERPAD